MVSQPQRWYDESVTDPFLKSLAETRRLAAQQECATSTSRLVVAIDQYAEAAAGDRSYFWISQTALAEVEGTAISPRR